ncbi:hypothetical protein BT63DRAFT_278314 [Microthyrium microscopicum]|uniref:Uncharacterized protein n=1 Tax=Microthyrium microscopicum TaxID=703497 RepID=A0A6A6U8I7_9PEZI|nr:hypothetical protein BT63DRAFT_278314 [Microthyrium microscopicum]
MARPGRWLSMLIHTRPRSNWSSLRLAAKKNGRQGGNAQWLVERRVHGVLAARDPLRQHAIRSRPKTPTEADPPRVSGCARLHFTHWFLLVQIATALLNLPLFVLRSSCRRKHTAYRVHACQAPAICLSDPAFRLAGPALILA